MKASKKRGFTMIELVIVIAVVAILAAVLIPVFSNLIEQAKEANDTTLVRNLNTAAKLGNKHYDTMYDVLKTVDEEGGYNVSKINAQSKSEILWDMENQCFVMLKDGEEVKSQNKYNYWKIYNNADDIPATDEQTYSIYLADNVRTDAIAVSTGFDAGNNEVLTNVTYTGTVDSKKVVLRTNSIDTELIVDAENDTVYHHGEVGKVTVKAVADHSYYEYGEAKAIIVSQGHVSVEQGAIVSVIMVPETTKNVLVDVANENTTVYAEDKSNVTVNATNRVKETPVENDVVEGAKLFAGGLGTEASPYLIATTEQALQIENAKKTTLFVKLVADVVVDNEVYLSGKTITFDLNGHSIKLEYGATAKPNNGGVLNISGRKSKLTVIDSSESQKGAVIGSDKTYPNKVTSAIRVGNYGKLDIYGGHFYGTSEGTSCIFVMTSMSSGSKATVNIYGGKFETASPSGGKYFVLNHQDSATAGCTITVNGGSFKNYNPGVTEVDPVNAKTGKISLGTGCTTTSEVIGNDTWYTVTKPAA